MRSYKTEGIVIKRRNFREADRIITVFTKNNGKIDIKATGTRRITSRRSPHLELLNYGIFSLYQAGGTSSSRMPILTEVESRESFPALKINLKKIGYAYHVCELVDSLCAENQENFNIFMLLGKTLRKISLLDNYEEIIKDFELKLLQALGFYSNDHQEEFDTQLFIENLLERKLKTRQILPSFTS